MSTSSTASTVSQTVRPEQITVQRPSGHPDDESARKRTQSAPGVFQKLKKPAPTPRPTDQQIDALLAELRAVNGSASADMHEPVTVSRSRSLSNETQQAESNYDQLIEELFHSQLSHATASSNLASRTQGIGTAITMLKQMNPEARSTARSEIIIAIGNGPPGAESDSLLAKVIDDFIAAHSDKSNDETNRATQSFVDELSLAVAGFPLRAKCQLLVLELWGAQKLNDFALAKAAIDTFANHLTDPDPGQTCKNITDTVPSIEAVPTRYGLMFAMALYRCAPEASPWKLRSLEAIAARDLLLPPSEAVGSFCKTLNQQIYNLRLAEAADL